MWEIPYFCMAAGTFSSVLTLFLWPSRAARLQKAGIILATCDLFFVEPFYVVSRSKSTAGHGA